MQESRRPWTKQEDNAVKKIVEEIGLKNWPLVSTLMIQKYHIEGRSGKQCRQRWHNQLNPQVNKLPWTEQEEKLLFQAHKTHRNRWIDISKLFAGRTDNSIKNHFYSTIRRSLRRICKLLGNKNSTSELRNIKPSILSKIFQYSELKGDQITKQNEYIVQESKIITQQLLNFARSKSSNTLQNLQDNKRKSLQFLISKLNEFSENYTFKKDSYRRHLIHREVFTPRKPRIIIVQSKQRSSEMIEEQQKSQSVEKGSNLSLQNQDKISKKYIYDWEQFQKRCLYVKQVFENQTESNRPDSPQLNSQFNSQSKLKSQQNGFCLEQKESQQKESGKAETFSTPKGTSTRGFEPYKTSQTNMTQLLDLKEECM